MKRAISVAWVGRCLLTGALAASSPGPLWAGGGRAETGSSAPLPTLARSVNVFSRSMAPQRMDADALHAALLGGFTAPGAPDGEAGARLAFSAALLEPTLARELPTILSAVSPLEQPDVSAADKQFSGILAAAQLSPAQTAELRQAFTARHGQVPTSVEQLLTLYTYGRLEDEWAPSLSEFASRPEVQDDQRRRAALDARNLARQGYGLDRIARSNEKLQNVQDRMTQTGRLTVVVNASYSTPDPKYAALDGVRDFTHRTAIPEVLSSILDDYPGVEVDVLVLAPTTIPEDVMEHYLRALSPERAQKVRNHFHQVSLDHLPDGPAPGNLPILLKGLPATHRALELARIRAKIEELQKGNANVPALMVGYNMTPLDYELGAKLGVPTWTRDPLLDDVGRKSGGYHAALTPLDGMKFGNATVRVTRAVTDIYSERQLVDGILELWDKTRAQKSALAKFWSWVARNEYMFVKLEDGVSGDGNARLNLPRWRNDEADRRGDIARTLRAMKFFGGRPWEQFLENIKIDGAALEVAIPRAGGDYLEFIKTFLRITGLLSRFPKAGPAYSPSGWEAVNLDGTVRVGSVQGQLLLNGNDWIGMTAPGRSDIRQALAQILREFASNKAKLGVRGPGAPDFIVIPKKKGFFAAIGSMLRRVFGGIEEVVEYEVWLVENNQRQIGSTGPWQMARAFTGAEHSEEDGTLRLPENGHIVSYANRVFNPYVDFYEHGTDLYKTFLDFLAGSAGDGVRFDPETKEGVVFPILMLLGGGKDFGIGAAYTAIAHAADEKEADARREALIARMTRFIEQFQVTLRAGAAYNDYGALEGELANGRHYRTIGTQKDARTKLLERGFVDRKKVGPLFDQFLAAEAKDLRSKVVLHPGGGYTIVTGFKAETDLIQDRMQRLMKKFWRSHAPAWARWMAP